jgi:hypothetical protein
MTSLLSRQTLMKVRNWPKSAVQVSIAGCKNEKLAAASTGKFRPEADAIASPPFAELVKRCIQRSH